MISELVFIRNYTNFWKSLFPGGDDYVRLINSALGVKFADNLDFNDIPKRRALINNVSFSLFELFIKRKIDKSEIEEFTVKNFALKSIIINESKRSSFNSDFSDSVNDEELKVIKWISSRLINNYFRENPLLLRPIFKGCGILFEATGDLIYKDVIVEIKAGDRNFNIQDIRQLYVYLALNHQSGKKKLHQMELFNPRTGVIWREFIDIVSDNIAGSSTIEIYNEIIDFISIDSSSI